MHMSYIYRYSVICLIPVLSIGEDIPSISDPTKYFIIIACTVTVQLLEGHRLVAVMALATKLEGHSVSCAQVDTEM